MGIFLIERRGKDHAVGRCYLWPKGVYDRSRRPSRCLVPIIYGQAFLEDRGSDEIYPGGDAKELDTPY